MKTNLTIKNFRIFDEEGVTFEFNPITILTGKNSAGKSTAVKAVMLLNSFFSQIKEDYNRYHHFTRLDKYRINFAEYPNSLLGRFYKVVHDGSATRDVTFEYVVYSGTLSKDVTVRLVFTADENDELNNAYLSSIKMSTTDGEFFSSTGDSETFINFNILIGDYVKNYFKRSGYNLDEISDEDIPSILDSIERRIQEDAEFHEELRKMYLREYNTVKRIINGTPINYAPILDDLAKIEKNEVGNYIKSRFLDKASVAMHNAFNRIIKDFLESPFDNFNAYYCDLEKKCFEHVTCHGILGEELRGVYFPNEHEMGFPRNYLVFNPHPDLKQPSKIEEFVNDGVTFGLLYEAIMEWNRLAYGVQENYMYSYELPNEINPYGEIKHFADEYLYEFFSRVFEETFIPVWGGNVAYVSSSRAVVRRLYALENNDDFSRLLQNYFESKRSLLERLEKSSQNNDHRVNDADFEKKIEKLDILDKRLFYMSRYNVDSFLNRWIEKFKIGKKLSICIDKEGLGAQLRLHKTENDEGRLLADEGYGITQLVSILLQIETAILTEICKNKSSSDTDNTITIAIEEPEIHLHPEYQSLLADMFLEAYEKYNIHFIIETHSEYLIRKTQVLVAKADYKDKAELDERSPFKVYYVPKGESPYEMDYRTDGKFSNEFGTGFFDEASRQLFKIL